MRKAGQRLKQLYIEQPVFQDILETALWAGGSAGYQALFTDMTPEQIATATTLGAGLAMGSRPIGARVGRKLGRIVDEQIPNFIDDDLRRFMPLTQKGMDNAERFMKKYGLPDKERELAIDLLKAKRNTAYQRPDGTTSGDIEAYLSLALRNRADNIVQAAAALIAPSLMGQPEQD